MESKRQKQVAKQVQKDLGEILLHHNSLWKGAFITLTDVKVTPDLSVARVYISILHGTQQQAAPSDKETLLLIEDKKGLIRQELGQKVRHQLRRVPELQFLLDTTEAEAQKIDALLESLHIPAPESDADAKPKKGTSEPPLSEDDF
ncbi:30S ribosome-binding factor RbfA [Hugenholtzia roseola]|uniref:30S ribosome-binding factor RbfA n=1 Tax=Hugenholtzia roseola TaxID=1002 RepID=UPI000685B663|nr:30S ribosome-binding factor RbfA [Hugenholtzia roseola]